MDRITEYAHKCRILRQIQSNKARRFRNINTAQQITTVVVSSFLTFIGFSGIDKIQTYLNWVTHVDREGVGLVFNLLVFMLLMLIILHLVFQFPTKQSQSEQAVVSLTSLINQIEDRIARAEGSFDPIREGDEETVRQRYDMLTQTIPPNTDREFLRARKDYQEKEAHKEPFRLRPDEIFDESRQRSAFESLIKRSLQVMRILDTLRTVDERLYLGGGLLRNLVWDYLHGFKDSTPIDDVDVVYFDKLSASKEHDSHLEEILRKKVPNLTWSVKNQARMHAYNHEEPYVSLADAVSKWPETATAFLARLTSESQLDIIAPYGFSDLFRLIVTPTPHFATKTDTVRLRLEQKGWETRWPKLKIFGVKGTSR